VATRLFVGAREDFAGSSSSVLYSGANAVQELSGSTPTANLISGGIDEIFTRADSSGAFTPLRDALGSTIALIDASGNLVTQYAYDPFGSTTVSGAASSNVFQYTGRENEGNGLYFYRARYYSSLLGRFVNEDPLGFAGSGTNVYAYVFDSPAELIDPFGLSPAGSGNGESAPSLAGRKDRNCKCALDINAFVKYLDDNAKPDYRSKGLGNCAAHVRMALQSGFGQVPGPNVGGYAPGVAKKYGDKFLPNLGFGDVTDEWNSQSGYGAELGDIAVFQPANGSNDACHIEVWDGTQWVSDYKQGAPLDDGTHFYPNLGTYGAQPYKIYRSSCKCH
jgi:RHS repeat-associated protein